MKPTIEALASRWEKEALAYRDQHPIPPGSSPNEITPEQQNAVNLCGLLRAKAHELRNLIKTTAP